MARPSSSAVLRCALVLSMLAASALAQASRPSPPPPQRLRVGVVGTPPFVVRTGGTLSGLSGLSVEVWRAMALRAGMDWELQPVDTVPQALEQVAQGTLDVAVGPLSITAERIQHVSFTQPYFQSSLAILAPRAKQGLGHWLAPFFSTGFLSAVGVLLLVLTLVGVLLWLAERRANPSQFPASPTTGIGNGIWMALVTMSTVGYGDRVPLTLAGRIITGVWMLVALITFSSLTAGIATALTLQGIEGTSITTLEQLRGRQTAVVAGSTGQLAAVSNGARLVLAPDLEAAIAQVLDGKADAVVFDRPMLQYYLLHHPDVALYLSEGSFETQGYGFALPIGSPIQHRLNVALLSLQESRALETLGKSWLGGG
ncbi:transporter substrate-binding domain-containing protein [Corallococcus sp. 4LFB]|uniref:transporter substrate-binding domain-containing protein n=1 Tax=Corallococcus sp. 4LFB TaxID=3383249 RepID=UPI003976C4C1